MNMRDLSEDEFLRERMDKLLHLIWADWAVGQVVVSAVGAEHGFIRMIQITYDG